MKITLELLQKALEECSKTVGICNADCPLVDYECEELCDYVSSTVDLIGENIY